MKEDNRLYKDREYRNYIKPTTKNRYELNSSFYGIPQVSTTYRCSSTGTKPISSLFKMYMGKGGTQIILPQSIENEPLFKHEFGILLYEMLSGFNMQFENLYLSKNQAEFIVRNDKGLLKSFVIKRNCQEPNTLFRRENGSSKKGFTTASTTSEQKICLKINASNGTLSNTNTGNVTNNDFVGNERTIFSKSVLESLEKHQSKVGHSSLVKNIQHRSGFNKLYGDLSLYEETKQYKIKDYLTVERFQRCKIRPTIIKRWAQGMIVSRNEEDTEISPRVAMEPHMYKRGDKSSMVNQLRLSLPVVKIHSVLNNKPQYTNKNVFLSDTGSSYVSQNYKPPIHATLNNAYQSQCLEVKASYNKIEKVSPSQLLGAVTQNFIFTKPKSRRLSTDTMNRNKQNNNGLEIDTQRKGIERQHFSYIKGITGVAQDEYYNVDVDIDTPINHEVGTRFHSNTSVHTNKTTGGTIKGRLSEVKEQQLSRLIEQVGKISTPSLGSQPRADDSMWQHKPVNSSFTNSSKVLRYSKQINHSGKSTTGADDHNFNNDNNRHWMPSTAGNVSENQSSTSYIWETEANSQIDAAEPKFPIKFNSKNKGMDGGDQCSIM